MRMRTIVGVLLATLLVLPVLAQPEAEAEPQAEERTVTMTAEGWTAAEVAAEIEKQTGVQVAVTEWTEGEVNGTLKDFTVEDAMRSLGLAAKTSWVRFYMLQTASPEEPYTASELILKLDEARDAWFTRLTDEQRAELFGRRGQRGGDRGGPPAQGEGGPPAEGEGGPAAEGEGGEQPEAQGDRGQRGEGDRGPGNFSMDGPGGAIAPPPPPEGAEEGQEGRRRFRARRDYEDPIRGLLLPNRTDTITLDLTDVPLSEALTQFTLNSRFLVVADGEFEGAVSLQLEEAPLSDALDAIAEAAGAQWRTVHIASAPRKLTEQELAQRENQREERFEEAFNERWVQFWETPREERTAQIQERVERIQRMQERMEQRLAQNPERAERWQRRIESFRGRMLERMTNYANQLSPEQRQEIKPLIQALRGQPEQNE